MRGAAARGPARLRRIPVDEPQLPAFSVVPIMLNKLSLSVLFVLTLGVYVAVYASIPV